MSRAVGSPKPLQLSLHLCVALSILGQYRSACTHAHESDAGEWPGQWKGLTGVVHDPAVAELRSARHVRRGGVDH
eukprot:COSAG06_NODE_16621_length_990_cov_1.309764_1_plen_74_part_01